MKKVIASILVFQVVFNFQLLAQHAKIKALSTSKQMQSSFGNSIEEQQKNHNFQMQLEKSLSINNPYFDQKQITNQINRVLISSNSLSKNQSLSTTFSILQYLSYSVLLISIFSSKIMGIQLFSVFQFSFLIMSNLSAPQYLFNVFSNNKILNGYNLQGVLQDYNSFLPSNLINNGYQSSSLFVNFNIMFLTVILVLVFWLIMKGIVYFLQSYSKKEEDKIKRKSEQIIGQATNLSLGTQNLKFQKLQGKKNKGKSNKNVKFQTSVKKISQQDQYSIDNYIQKNKLKRDQILEKKQKTQQRYQKIKNYCKKIQFILLRQIFISLFIFTLPNAIFSCGLQLYYSLDAILQVQQFSISTVSGLCLLIYFILLGFAFYVLCTDQKTNTGQLKCKLKTNTLGNFHLLIMSLQIIVVNFLMAFLNDSNICSYLILSSNICYLVYIIGYKPFKKNIQNYRSFTLNIVKFILTFFNIVYRNWTLNNSADLFFTIFLLILLFFIVSLTFGFLIRQISYGCRADSESELNQHQTIRQHATTQTQGDENQIKDHGTHNVHLIKVQNANQSKNISGISNNQNLSQVQLKKKTKKTFMPKGSISDRRVKNIDDEQFQQPKRQQNRKESQFLNSNRIKKLKIYIPKIKKVQFDQQQNTHQDNTQKKEGVKVNQLDKYNKKSNSNIGNLDQKILNSQRTNKKYSTKKIQINKKQSADQNMSFKQL